jgi:ABC-type branched-subunit amino acid transport system ATPase component
MENGKIVLDGPAQQLMSDPAVINTYLGQVLAAPASVA